MNWPWNWAKSASEKLTLFQSTEEAVLKLDLRLFRDSSCLDAMTAAELTFSVLWRGDWIRMPIYAVWSCFRKLGLLARTMAGNEQVLEGQRLFIDRKYKNWSHEKNKPGRPITAPRWRQKNEKQFSPPLYLENVDTFNIEFQYCASWVFCNPPPTPIKKILLSK